MSKLPKSLAMLAAIVGFCAAQLLSMLRGTAPLASMKRSLLCALALAVLTWLCAYVAVSVFHEGLKSPQNKP